ncbi:MAG: hypothetical protein ACJATI_005105, partial [Halioglobus sp.]
SAQDTWFLCPGETQNPIENDSLKEIFEGWMDNCRI